MTINESNARLTYWAGVALGPAAWAANLQGVYAITHLACEKAKWGGIALSTLLVLGSLAGAVISARAIRRRAGIEWNDTAGGGPRAFLAWLGVGTGVLFALVIADQLLAALVISPCLR
ncbi:MULTISPECIES: Rossmann-fold NAD(P)-binding domain-containing protein [Bradyrhizobium]